MRKILRGAVLARFVPGVDPVDHAEQAHHGCAGIKIQIALALQVVHQAEADAVVLALDGSDFGVEAILQGFIFMGQNFEAALIGYEIFEMVLNKDADALFGIGDSLESRFEFGDNGGESVFLDQVQQALFGTEVVIKSCERHAAGAGEVAHGCPFVAFLAKNIGGMSENFA